MKGSFFENDIFENKYQKYASMVYRIAYQYTLDSSYSEDIIQEVFIKLFLNTKAFENEEHEKAWIIRVTINLCKNVIKSKKYNYLELFENLEPSETNIENQHNIENRIDISRAIQTLNHNERICVLLYYYEDYTTIQISKTLKINENTVKSHLRRAKSKLKNLLER